MPPKRKIIYITGLDRSGSTITGTLIGQDSAIAYFGELQFYPKAVLSNRVLNNGQSINEITFWKAIQQAFSEKFGPGVFIDFLQLKNKFERWRYLPLLLLCFFVKHDDLKRYWAYNLYLVDTLLSQSGTSTICDSSKNMVRRIALGLSGYFDFQTIFLIRDARGYWWSKKKQSQRTGNSVSLLQVCFKWIVNNLLFALISVSRGFLFIRYEEIYRLPEKSFATMSKKLNTDISCLAEIIKKKKSIKIEQVIAGSLGVRNKSAVVAELDTSWESQLSEKEKKSVFLFTGWLMFIFGYFKG